MTEKAGYFFLRLPISLRIESHRNGMESIKISRA